jgi:hypothetical protein
MFSLKIIRSYAVDDRIVVGAGLARHFSYDPDRATKPAPTKRFNYDPDRATKPAPTRRFSYDPDRATKPYRILDFEVRNS